LANNETEALGVEIGMEFPEIPDTIRAYLCQRGLQLESDMLKPCDFTGSYQGTDHPRQAVDRSSKPWDKGYEPFRLMFWDWEAMKTVDPPILRMKERPKEVDAEF